ncbi:right-handed parallel beta-helix repeat-containing protein [Ruegeria sp. 2012CJ41-6]|uniref:Right-handed parallel beta-helix repeat-containing protein n=1 Tax=Ruegeria spongiae TaxID=2942209 RepID=A0ABT0Q7H0_9RHOB|nr:parallel beta-helix domain-containing protein [Ruegeria spongiae]MCL6285821.1 right-handed parallel beta-helix repeat-containing protein [Ruegeria spongiae]
MQTKLIVSSFLCTTALAGSVVAAEWTVPSGAVIQDYVDQAQQGDTVLVEPGVYNQTVYIDKPNITLRGLRDGDNWAVMDGEYILNDGLITSGHSSTIEGFYVKGYKGNGIMTQGANNFKILNNYVEGAFYGIFPQYGTNGLLQGNTVTGAEDAGIYVGMSDNIDVIENIAFGNVMGLEFENTRNGLMANNHTYGNTAGITLTLIPGLPVKDSYDMVIRDNLIEDNNLPNFAPSSSVAAGVPQGIGIGILGPDGITIVNNEIKNNGTSGILIADQQLLGVATDPKVDPFTDGMRILENTFSGNGEDPTGILGNMSKQAGASNVDVFAAGKGRGSCIVEQEGVSTLGTKRWEACDTSEELANYETAMLEGGADEPVYTAEQKGRLTYLAVCTGCHTYSSVLHGPSMQSIQALYKDNPDGMIEYIKAPVVKREGFPEMPPQAYLGEANLAAIANYILTELGQN